MTARDRGVVSLAIGLFLLAGMLFSLDSQVIRGVAIITLSILAIFEFVAPAQHSS